MRMFPDPYKQQSNYRKDSYRAEKAQIVGNDIVATYGGVFVALHEVGGSY